MITFDALRTALLSDLPWTRLDELVRTEQSSGRTTKQIFNELNGMWKQIEQIPDLSADGKDAFGDTLDALSGMCHRDCQYKDPPNTTLPTEEEIAKLPHWAQVAFAARCARRVQGLLPRLWPEIPHDDIQTVEKSITHAESVATTAQPDPGIKNVFKLGAVDAAHKIAAEAQSHHYLGAGAVATTAATAMYAAYTDVATRQTYSTAYHAEFASSKLEPPNSITVLIRRDFDHLINLSKWQHWTDDTPVPPEVFGPMWPEGPPKGWPPITDVPQRTELPLAFVARDGTPSLITEDDMVNLFNALNRYHIARGGVPLTYEDLRSLLPAFVPAEV